MKKTIGVALLVGTAALASAMASLWHFQEKLIYFPQFPDAPGHLPYRPSDFPELLTSTRVVDVSVDTDDGCTLHGWLFSPLVSNKETFANSDRATTLLFWHGNAGSVSHRLWLVDRLYRDGLQLNFLMVDYRGYGLSTGSPSERGLTVDAVSVLDALRRDAQFADIVDPERVVLFGRSLGGGVALKLAALRANRVRGVIVENTFTSLDDMVGDVAPLFAPVRFLLRNHFDNLAHVDALGDEMPLLVVSGRHDRIIAPAHSDALFARAVGDDTLRTEQLSGARIELTSSATRRRSMLSVARGGHEDCFRHAGIYYVNELHRFAAECTRSNDAAGRHSSEASSSNL
jgi:abhydrolase domain-containing protein 13